MITVKQALISNLVNTGMSESQASEVVNITKEQIGNDLRLEDSIHSYDEVIIQLWISSVRKCALNWIEENKPEAWYKPMFLSRTNDQMQKV